MVFSALLQKMKRTEALTGVSAIARRYFAMNAFDGAVTIIGVIGGSYAAGVTDPKVVITTGLSTAFAMGISGLWGAYLTESAERARALDEMGVQMLRDLKDTRHGLASRRAVFIVTVVDGISPVLAALIALIPFFLHRAMPSLDMTYGAGFGAALFTLVGIGLFLGRISKQNMVVSALKTLLAGAFAILLSFLL